MSTTNPGSSENNDALPHANIKCIKNSVDTIDISNWGEAFQVDSMLVSEKFNVDCLLHILNHLSLHDSHQFGLCCRFLYNVWIKRSKTVKAVEITRCDYAMKMRKSIFKSNICKDACEKKNVGKLIRFKNELIGELPKLETFVNTFVNLRSLEMSFVVKDKHFAFLLTKLANSMHLLITLKLYPDFEVDRSVEKSPEYFWSALAQLQHPTLKHLTIIPSEMTYDICVYSIDHLYVIPLLPILKQLVCFSLFLSASPSKLLPIIRQLTIDSSHGARLAPGVGARFELSLRHNSYKELALQTELLPYFTYLEVKIMSSDYQHDKVELKARFFRCLPQMIHLQKVKLTIGPERQSMVASDFPFLLTVLASLEHLKDLAIDCHENYAFGKQNAWPPASMPVIPAVRILTLQYHTADHTDIVEQFQLNQCFPNLRQLKVNFDIAFCRRCPSLVNSLIEKRHQDCGRELTQGLLNLKTMQPKISIEMSFTFNKNFIYDSIDSLHKGKTCWNKFTM